MIAEAAGEGRGGLEPQGDARAHLFGSKMPQRASSCHRRESAQARRMIVERLKPAEREQSVA
jgi:hypothetical protein